MCDILSVGIATPRHFMSCHRTLSCHSVSRRLRRHATSLYATVMPRSVMSCCPFATRRPACCRGSHCHSDSVVCSPCPCVSYPVSVLFFALSGHFRRQNCSAEPCTYCTGGFSGPRGPTQPRETTGRDSGRPVLREHHNRGNVWVRWKWPKISWSFFGDAFASVHHKRRRISVDEALGIAGGRCQGENHSKLEALVGQKTPSLQVFGCPVRSAPASSVHTWVWMFQGFALFSTRVSHENTST